MQQSIYHPERHTESLPLQVGINTSLPCIEFALNTRTATRLNKSFSINNRADLVSKTLLDDNTHSKHAVIIEDRFKRKFGKVSERELAKQKRNHDSTGATYDLVPYTDHQIADKTLRLFTLLHEVVELDSDSAVYSAMRMKKELITAISEIDGMACLGAIEVEVISIPLMNELHTARQGGIQPPETDDPIEPYRLADVEKITAINEYRKLEVCKKLGQHLNGSIFQSDRGQLLVHFHGVLVAKKKTDFEKLEALMKSNKQWSIADRQIRISEFSTHWGKDKVTHEPISKSIDESLTHIAKYITKGGMDKRNDATCLKYKLRFSDGTLVSTKEYKAITNRASWLLRNNGVQDNKEHEQHDPLALTSNEIFVLGDTINKLMDKDTTRTGYTICVGRW